MIHKPGLNEIIPLVGAVLQFVAGNELLQADLLVGYGL